MALMVLDGLTLPDAQAEPARAADLIALHDFELEREGFALRDMPAAEICARGTGARVFDEAAVLGEEEPRAYRAVVNVCPHIRQSVAFVSDRVAQQQFGIRLAALDRVRGGERHDQLLRSGVHP